MAGMGVTLCLAGFAQKPETPASQMEKLDRGVVMVPRPGASNYFLSWRLLGTDNEQTTFKLLRDDAPYANGKVYDNTTGVNVQGTANTTFRVVTLQNGVAVDTTAAVKPWATYYKELKLDRPTGNGCTYSPNDCSVGDVDGDGQYEIFVKWDPDNSKDNSQDGKTGNVFIDCYRLDGTKLWRIDLGVNIRAGAHYTQFMVYDFDKDGKAELMCKTAPGSKDGAGNYVNQAATDARIKAADNAKDWRTSSGRVNGGQEYLTVFNGETGAAVSTIAYFPNRNTLAELSEAEGTFNWDDRSGKSDKGSYGNRGERYLAAVAYLDGPEGKVSGIFTRGYYTYAYVWAVDFDGQQLKHRWLHRSDSNTQWSVVGADMTESAKVTAPASKAGEGRNTMYGNGNHNISVADVDGDGKDEILWGSAAVDDDGKLLYSVGFGHGDAIHLGDMIPSRPGLELFDIHEDEGTYAWDLHDAATGEIIWKGGQSGVDNGRGLAADIIADSEGYEFWSSYGGFDSGKMNRNPFNAVTGEQVGTTTPSMNFRIYWDADAQDELLDNGDNGPSVTKYGESKSLGVGTGAAIIGQMNNGTKATPCLTADIFGDWREEIIVRNATNDGLNIFTTVTPTQTRVPTLMHDHTYRMGVAWQNTGYNQPPHLGYYLPDFIESFAGKNPATGIRTVEAGKEGHDSYVNLMGVSVEYPTKGIYVRQGKKVVVK